MRGAIVNPSDFTRYIPGITATDPVRVGNVAQVKQFRQSCGLASHLAHN